MKISIKNTSGDVVFEHDVENNTVAVTVQAMLDKGMSLTKLNLAVADLRGMDFSDRDFRGSDFRGANLRGVNFSGADLRWVDFRDADLHEANMTEANMTEANMTSSDMTDANLTRADMTDVSTYKTKLVGAVMVHTNLTKVDMSDCDLTGANVDYSIGWEFQCRKSRFKIGMDFAHQVLAHLCSCTSDDPEFKELREKMLPYALKSHRSASLLDDYGD